MQIHPDNILVAKRESPIALERADAVRVLRRFITNDCPVVVGSWWVDYVVVPACRVLAAPGCVGKHRALLSDVAYSLGDVFDTLHLPSVAAEYYRISVKLDRENGHAWRELAIQQSVLGSTNQAIASLRSAIKLDAPLATSDLERLESDPWSFGRYDYDSIVASFALALGSGNHDLAATCAKRIRSPAERLLSIARLAAAKSDVLAYCSAWQQLIATRESIVTSNSDWYYMPPSMREMPCILHAWRQAIPKWNVAQSVLPWWLNRAAVPITTKTSLSHTLQVCIQRNLTV
jgi:tetratricopeptide (TPR) repeat protein